ncbi:DUF1015 domain-containing protein [Lachnoclostridium sp. Marseille-P6806]|uniref:DUF1015 domain-containing protein n=1 Tax=Lachnoclostridium sp. Marseille-P6806 TaxID=2364793 RepID=UPI001030B87B|nr:DUF1015 family protein [Lachnoclostridium sp. Marseille-P6806]
MADIRAFAAYRPKEGLESAVAALPYDVYSREEARRFVRSHPLSFLGIDRAESQFPDDITPEDPRVYARARDMLRAGMENGSFVQDPERCFYIYAQTRNGRTQAGIVALVSIDDYRNGVIRRHENTRRDKEDDRTRHIAACGAQTGPVFLAYRSDAAISDMVMRAMETPPVFDFLSEGGVRNRGWMIADHDEQQLLAKHLSRIDCLYIADGHHRCAAAVRVGLAQRAERDRDGIGEREADYVLSVLFPENQLEILAYNRVLKTMNGHSPDELLTLLARAFLVSAPQAEAVVPVEKGQFGLYLGNRWYHLVARPGIRRTDPVGALDVSLLQREVLAPVFGITDPRTDPAIDFVGGIRGTAELERRCHEDCVCAFSMFPTSMGELFAVSDIGELMPPKSTWFEPKLLSGLFIHRI